MSSDEFSEWMAYYSVEPFGREPDDLSVGIISATIANAHKGKSKKSFKPKDFIPTYGEAPKPTWQQMLAKVEQLNKAFGGKDLRNDRTE